MEASLPAKLRTEIRIFKGVAIAFLALLWGYHLLTLSPPLSVLKSLLYAALTLGLIAIHGIHFFVPLGSETLGRVAFTVVWSAALVVAIALLLRGRSLVYFYLVAFDGYAGLRFVSGGRRWSLGFVLAVAALSGLVYARFGMLNAWWGSLPAFALAGFVAEFVIQQWEHRSRLDQVLGDLTQAHRQLQDYTAQAESLAIAQERNRLAHEIHDTLGHTLTTLDVQLGLLAHLPPEMAVERKKAVENAQKLVATGLQDVRRAVKALKPEALETFSLPEAIAELARNFEETAQIEAVCQFTGKARPIPPRLTLPLYRVTQEALTNVRRHAGDTQGVRITFDHSPAWVELQVINAPPEKAGQSPKPYEDLDTLTARGNGLRGMQERAATLGGEFQAGPTEEGGFRVWLKLPVG